MSALETEPWPVLLRRVPDGRPPGHRFSTGDGPGWTGFDDPEPQPTLLDALRDLLEETTGPPRPLGVRFHVDRSAGSVEPAAGLPEPAGWTAVLGLAIGQTLAGTRPVSQLACWLEPVVLADLRYALRQRSRRPGRARAVTVLSVRAQCPSPTAAETTTHLRIGPEPVVLGIRLDGYGDRWLCTALARPKPEPSAVSGSRPARDTA